MKKLLYPILFLILATGIAGVGIISYRSAQDIKKSITGEAQSSDSKIALLQKQIGLLQEQLNKTTGENTAVALSLQEIKNRQAVREKSQDELVTVAVSKVAPGVVSIVISKDVPQLEVTYVNPFGDDPFFKDFSIQVPVYKQKGIVHQKVGAGSGFFVTSNGYILTNKHVVSDMQADYTALLSTGKQAKASVMYRDPKNDIALVKIDGVGYPTVSLADSDSLKLGQTVIAIGNALGKYNNSVSIGIVSGLNRSIEASSGNTTEQLTGVIQTDAAINPGNSGGPLINTNGEVIGINVATVQGSSNISFSIPINAVKSIITSVVK